MPTDETAIELLARAMIDRHGADAAKAAVVRLNQIIDFGDWEGRERWACVVHAIHRNQGISLDNTARSAAKSAPASGPLM
jgi:hypothetical protein